MLRDDWLLCYNYSLVERKGAGFIRCMPRFNGSRVSFIKSGGRTHVGYFPPAAEFY